MNPRKRSIPLERIDSSKRANKRVNDGGPPGSPNRIAVATETSFKVLSEKLLETEQHGQTITRQSSCKPKSRNLRPKSSENEKRKEEKRKKRVKSEKVKVEPHLSASESKGRNKDKNGQKFSSKVSISPPKAPNLNQVNSNKKPSDGKKVKITSKKPNEKIIPEVPEDKASKMKEVVEEDLISSTFQDSELSMIETNSLADVEFDEKVDQKPKRQRSLEGKSSKSNQKRKYIRKKNRKDVFVQGNIFDSIYHDRVYLLLKFKKYNIKFDQLPSEEQNLYDCLLKNLPNGEKNIIYTQTKHRYSINLLNSTFFKHLKNSNKTRIIVRKESVLQIFKKMHEDFGHLGINSLNKQFKLKFYFHHSIDFSKKVVKECVKCKNNVVRSLYGPLNVNKTYKRMERVQVDLIHLNSIKERAEFNFLLNFIDLWSRKLVSYPLLDKKELTVIEHLRLYFSNFFIPDIIHCDNGSEFGTNFENVCRENNVVIRHGTPHYPQSQGCVERVNKTIKQRLRKFIDSNPKQPFISILQKTIIAYNTTYHSAIGASPNEMFLLGDNQKTIKHRQAYIEKLQTQSQQNLYENDIVWLSNYIKKGNHYTKMFTNSFTKAKIVNIEAFKMADVKVLEENKAAEPAHYENEIIRCVPLKLLFKADFIDPEDQFPNDD